MAQIVCQADRFGERLVQLQGGRNGARDLRDLHGMRQTGAVQIALVIDEHLGLVDQCAKGVRMNNAIAVALVFATELRWGSAKRRPRTRIRAPRTGQGPMLRRDARHGQPK